ncbi:flavin monoamine oxidase family protein [Aphanothece sacrum]|uniref:Monoamine oxidase n=1 Tax=Aphanothece sacrum FPU1 TaxID=1920663 RepID=A0A401IE94_APHSA|nr:FAD-dependent oxidoreductase [Aphanothece sacrum]GBF79598.1 monoamine oxidase [Aphanothece sacrum FPU1]GBF87058.1 monoamine oxidase [Aphanothece sacrum FPU3]
MGYYFKRKVWPEAELANLLNPISQQIAQDSALLEENFGQYAPSLDALSVTQYLDKHRGKISHPVVQNLLENSIRTEYGVEPQNSSALQLINNLPKVENKEVNVLGNSDEIYCISGGTGALINELVKSLNSEQIKTYKQLIKIQSEANQFKLTFQDNSHVLADYVILAIPLTTLRKVNIQVSLPDSLKRFIQTVDLGNNEKVFAKFTHAVWQQETGFIKEAWTDLGTSEIWESTTSLTPPSEPLLTFFLGGNEATSTIKMTGRVLGNTLIKQLDSVISGVKEAATGDFWRTAWQNERLIQGAYTNFKPGQYTEFQEWMYIDSENPVETQKVRVENLIFAGEQFSANYYGYMNGAAETGRLAAQTIIETLFKNVSTQ